MAQRLANRQARDRHDCVIQVGHQLGPPGASDIGDELRLDDRAKQCEHRVDPGCRLGKWRPYLEKRAGVLLDHTGLEIGRADIEDASHDARASQDIRGLTVGPDAVLHGDDRGVRTEAGDFAARVLNILRLDGE